MLASIEAKLFSNFKRINLIFHIHFLSNYSGVKITRIENSLGFIYAKLSFEKRNCFSNHLTLGSYEIKPGVEGCSRISPLQITKLAGPHKVVLHFKVTTYITNGNRFNTTSCIVEQRKGGMR
jgi:hypothetical protein